jgi:hypothetical protein
MFTLNGRRIFCKCGRQYLSIYVSRLSTVALWSLVILFRIQNFLNRKSILTEIFYFFSVLVKKDRNSALNSVSKISSLFFTFHNSLSPYFSTRCTWQIALLQKPRTFLLFLSPEFCTASLQQTHACVHYLTMFIPATNKLFLYNLELLVYSKYFGGK